jgi:hypothetical protein
LEGLACLKLMARLVICCLSTLFSLSDSASLHLSDSSSLALVPSVTSGLACLRRELRFVLLENASEL